MYSATQPKHELEKLSVSRMMARETKFPEERRREGAHFQKKRNATLVSTATLTRSSIELCMYVHAVSCAETRLDYINRPSLTETVG